MQGMKKERKGISQLHGEVLELQLKTGKKPGSKFPHVFYSSFGPVETPVIVLDLVLGGLVYEIKGIIRGSASPDGVVVPLT